MKINILAFGIAKEIFGGRHLSLEVGPNPTVAALKADMEEIYPGLKKLKSYLIAVNDEYAGDDVQIKAFDEVALIPPVSGG